MDIQRIIDTIQRWSRLMDGNGLPPLNVRFANIERDIRDVNEKFHDFIETQKWYRNLLVSQSVAFVFLLGYLLLDKLL